MPCITNTQSKHHHHSLFSLIGLVSMNSIIISYLMALCLHAIASCCCCCYCLPIPLTLVCGGGGVRHPDFGPPASLSLHLGSSSITPAGYVHKSRGDIVGRMWMQLKRWWVSCVWVLQGT